MLLQDFIFDSPQITVRCENGNADAAVTKELDGTGLMLTLCARESKPCFVEVYWPVHAAPNLLVLGDAWERSYGDLCFLPLKNNDRAMPWYFMATDKTESFCFGVKTQPNAFVSFRFDANGIRALIDCRNGARGVELNGRALRLCTFIYMREEKLDPFYALCNFCKRMCDAPLLPAAPVYGGNDWYYAYGSNSYESVKNDAALQAKFAQGIENRPYMVIDDGWEQGGTAGPWLPNGKFGDMRAACSEIKRAGARPGIWMRPLRTALDGIPEEQILQRGNREYLDPSHPETLRRIADDITRIRGWGYELLKHDFSTFDIFGAWGKDLTDTITNEEGWRFFDRTKTSAEILLQLYKTIRAAAGDMLVIGCNTVSHLVAGFADLNRTGDDTSGREWARTLKMGVNTLAFRLAQNSAFYMGDADCVGMLEDRVPWEKNKQWLTLLANSNTALFLSCREATLSQTEEIAEAFRTAQQKHTIRPLDWYETKTPCVWEIDGRTVTFRWD